MASGSDRNHWLNSTIAHANQARKKARSCVKRSARHMVASMSRNLSAGRCSHDRRSLLRVQISALPITSAGRFSPLGPLGILTLSF
jgi:hypothetical protein